MADALARAEQRARSGLHAVGFLSYEAGAAFDPAMPRGLAPQPAAPPLPLLRFDLYAEARVVPLPPAVPTAPLAWTSDLAADDYDQAIGTIREAIAAGDVYQVNLTARLRAPFSGDPFALFLGMHARQQGRFAAWLDYGAQAVLSASPELFIHRAGDTVTTRPMKGTAPRGRWADEDAERAAALVASEKERAENVMIVDLLRNDLGRLAVPGTVRVPALFAAERYPSVWQLTSTVQAEVPAGTTTAALIGALFPCGSITGAPKISAMQMIARLERSPRGVYCGAIGHIGPEGDATFSVAIRTATVDRERRVIEYGAGGGITWDSVAGAEHAELLEKAAIATAPWTAFELLETMRCEDGRIVRAERHRSRLLESARYFGFDIDEARLDAVLAEAASGRGVERLRLLADRDGRARIERRPLGAGGSGLHRVALSTDPVASGDPFLCHKTTHRAAYDSRRARRPDVDDVLLVNEHGELTEFTRGNLVVELDGRRWTPPRAAGLLPGVLRAELLEAGTIAERRLVPGDLAQAAAVWLVSSLRGWVPAALVD